MDQGRRAGGALDAAVLSPVPRERSATATVRAGVQPGESVAAAGAPDTRRLLVVDQPPAAPRKTGGRLLKHARFYWLLLAESHLTRRLFGAMLRRIWALPVSTS
jgi:hypothetical protein